MEAEIKKWALIFSITIFVLGFIIGAVVTTLSGAEPARMQHEDQQHSHGHVHDLMEFTGEVAPTITLEATPDTKAGYNLRFITENFAFAPQAAGSEHVSGEGHIHLYVNDVKVARVYSEFFHLEAQPGDQVHATLNTNMHMTYARDGVEISDELILE